MAKKTFERGDQKSKFDRGDLKSVDSDTKPKGLTSYNLIQKKMFHALNRDKS